MKNSTTLVLFVVLILGLSCGSNTDAKSNLVFGMGHVVSGQRVNFQLSTDRSYFILIDNEPVDYRGSLDANEFESLSSHVSDAAVARLNEEVSRQAPQCDLDGDPDSYFLHFIGGGGCLLATQFTDEQAEQDFEYLVGVFDAKASEHGIH